MWKIKKYWLVAKNPIHYWAMCHNSFHAQFSAL
jgi:hypothetical protein